MKIIIVMLSLVYALFAANAESAALELDYYENFNKAFDIAKKEHKILMLVIVQDPCPYCDRLVEKTLDNERVKKALKDIVCVIVDKRGKYPKELRTPFVPRTYFLDTKKEKILADAAGYVQVDHFLMTLDEAKRKMR